MQRIALACVLLVIPSLAFAQRHHAPTKPAAVDYPSWSNYTPDPATAKPGTVSIPSPSADAPTLDQLGSFPERYAGKSYTANLYVDPDVRRDDGYFNVSVSDMKTGASDLSAPSFIISNGLAAEIVDKALNSGSTYGAHVTFYVYQTAKGRYICAVTRIDMLTVMGEVKYTFTGDAVILK